MLLAPYEEIATLWQSCAMAHGLLLRSFWRQPFFVLPPFARAGMHWPEACPRARAFSGRLVGIPIPPLAGGA